MQMAPRCLLLVLLQPAIAAAQLVTFYKTYADGEFGGQEGGCAQIMIPRDMASGATAFGLAEGSCDGQGYATPNGERSMDFPGLGPIKAHFYQKGAAEGDVTMYHSEEDDSCGQIKVPKAKVSELQRYGLSVGTCAMNGYGVAGGTDKVDIPGCGKQTVNFFFKKAPEKVVSGVSMYIIQTSEDYETEEQCDQFYGCKCLQTLIPEKFDPDSFTSWKRGSCAGKNYPISADTKRMTLPKLGKVLVDVFKMDTMIAHQIDVPSDMCQETNILKKDKSVLESTTALAPSACEAGYLCGWKTCTSEGYNINDCDQIDPKKAKTGLREGTCASAGYSSPNGINELHLDSIKGREFGIGGPQFLKEGQQSRGIPFCCPRRAGEHLQSEQQENISV